MGDFPVAELGDRTPLQAAQAPMMRKIAAHGDLRMVNTVPEGLPPGSDVANMAILGYDAALNYTGRAPIEAAGADIPMAPDEVAFRCNLVTVEEGDVGLFGWAYLDRRGGSVDRRVTSRIGRGGHHLSCRRSISSSIDLERGRSGRVLHATPRN